MGKKEISHIPVLVDKVLKYLDPKNNGIYLDCTVGMGGHALAILEQSSPNGRLIGLDIDSEAIAAAKVKLTEYVSRINLFHANYTELDSVLDNLGIDEVDGILFDIGVSSLQLDKASRGFSFQRDGPLDMRMDTNRTLNAKKVVNSASRDKLLKIFKDYGEERWSKRIANRIVDARKREPITTTSQLAELVVDAVPVWSRYKQKIHPATRIFQALRIYINDELDNLKVGLEKAVKRLNIGAVICVISFHSLEDQIVKNKFRLLASECICPPGLSVCVCNHEPSLKLLTRRPISPEDSEIERNPRSRSAKLRAARKIERVRKKTLS